jgi:predicted small integral membrane protein
MRFGKIVLVFGMGLFLCLAAMNNTLSLHGTYGAVKSALDMQGTFKVPALMWRAFENPAYIWMAVAGIIACEAVAGLVCLWGAGRMWAARSSAAAFNSAKSTALLGLSIAAALYLVGFQAFAGEWFMLWQNREAHTLDEAFRDFGLAMLTMLWVRTTDE